jgi:hypothetical protein
VRWDLLIKEDHPGIVARQATRRRTAVDLSLRTDLTVEPRGLPLQTFIFS